jgi:hypothetical protein
VHRLYTKTKNQPEAALTALPADFIFSYFSARLTANAEKDDDDY